MSKKRVFFVLIALQMWSLPAAGQGPPIHTDTPIFLGLEGRGLRTVGKFVSGESGKSFAVPVIVPYNLHTKVLVGAAVPFVWKQADGVGSRSGFGDVTLFAKGLLLQHDGIGKTLRVAVKVMETFPVGSEGAPAIGSGAYQTYGGIVAAYVSTRVGLYSDVGYNLVSDGQADGVLYNLAIGYPLFPVTYPPRQLNLYLELNGSTLPAEGGHTIFLSPGIQLIPSRRFLVEAGLELPVKETAGAVEKDFVFSIGTRILIF